jgi:hypothetical protein
LCAHTGPIHLRADKDGWQAKREIVLLERAKRVGVHASKEQEFIRAQECELARRLMGLGWEILRTIKPGKASVTDLCRVLDLASRLGRLGSGLPLTPMELTVRPDLSEEWKEALRRVYGDGPEPAKVEDVEPAKELPPDGGITA